MPSLWRTYAMARRIVLATILGQTTLSQLMAAPKNVHQRLAHSRRKRIALILYPIKALS